MSFAAGFVLRVSRRPWTVRQSPTVKRSDRKSGRAGRTTKVLCSPSRRTAFCARTETFFPEGFRQRGTPPGPRGTRSSKRRRSPGERDGSISMMMPPRFSMAPAAEGSAREDAKKIRRCPIGGTSPEKRGLSRLIRRRAGKNIPLLREGRRKGMVVVPFKRRGFFLNSGVVAAQGSSGQVRLIFHGQANSPGQSLSPARITLFFAGRHVIQRVRRPVGDSVKGTDG